MVTFGSLSRRSFFLDFLWCYYADHFQEHFCGKAETRCRMIAGNGAPFTSTGMIPRSWFHTGSQWNHERGIIPVEVKGAPFPAIIRHRVSAFPQKCS